MYKNFTLFYFFLTYRCCLQVQLTDSSGSLPATLLGPMQKRYFIAQLINYSKTLMRFDKEFYLHRNTRITLPTYTGHLTCTLIYPFIFIARHSRTSRNQQRTHNVREKLILPKTIFTIYSIFDAL